MFDFHEKKGKTSASSIFELVVVLLKEPYIGQ